MSLINDALKKAQRQRTGETPPLASMPGVGGEPAARIAKRARPAGFNELLLKTGMGAGALLAVLVVGGYFALRNRPTETPAVPGSPQVSLPSDRSGAPSRSNGQSATVQAPVTFVLPVAPSSPPVAKSPDEPSQGSPREGRPPTVSAAGASAANPQALGSGSALPTSGTQVSSPSEASRPDEPAVASATAADAPRMESSAITYIENIRIAGIRASATDAKVLMNDRVYRIGDMVSHELGLRLIGITSSSLTFEDGQGARFTRNF